MQQYNFFFTKYISSCCYCLKYSISTCPCNYRVSEERPGCLGLVGSTEPIFSGLFSYHVSTNTWTPIASDAQPHLVTEPALRSRVGHSMLFHPVRSPLYLYLLVHATNEENRPCFHQHVDTNSVRWSTLFGHGGSPAVRSWPVYALPSGQCSSYTSVSASACKQKGNSLCRVVLAVLRIRRLPVVK